MKSRIENGTMWRHDPNPECICVFLCVDSQQMRESNPTMQAVVFHFAKLATTNVHWWNSGKQDKLIYGHVKLIIQHFQYEQDHLLVEPKHTYTLKYAILKNVVKYIWRCDMQCSHWAEIWLHFLFFYYCCCDVFNGWFNPWCVVLNRKCNQIQWTWYLSIYLYMFIYFYVVKWNTYMYCAC